MSDTPIISPERTETLSTEGLPTDRFHSWIDDMTTRMNEGQNLPTLEGSGSPEGVVTAIKDRRYRDTVGATFYNKTTASGDTGWVLV